MTPSPRIVCQFSCGAASAVATKLALSQHAGKEIEIVNAFIKEEHYDNRRFLNDCEIWFGRRVTVLRDDKYGASTDEVWRRKRYTKGIRGAPCSKALKRDLLDSFRRPDDIMVLGYTAEEQARLDAFLDHHPSQVVMAPLIERGLGKADCLSMVQRAGIELPVMYRLGYNNANCIGCIKGGEGYWNKIRVDFPERFAQVAEIERQIGPSAYLFRDRKTGERFSLTDLPPDKGRHQDEPEISCSFHCEMAEADYEHGS